MTDSLLAASVDPLDVVRSRSLTGLVRDEIGRRIVERTLAPGDKLNEADWAARLRVSRGPVREAFRALEQAGLVRTGKHRGVFVRTVSSAEADELHAVRAVLEEAACRMLAGNIDAAKLALLRDRFDAMRDGAAAHDHDEYARANLGFYDALVAAAGNLKLYDTYRRLIGELSLCPRAALDSDAGAIARSLAGHRAILTALASRDAEQAAALMRVHRYGGWLRADAASERGDAAGGVAAPARSAFNG